MTQVDWKANMGERTVVSVKPESLSSVGDALRSVIGGCVAESVAIVFDSNVGSLYAEMVGRSMQHAGFLRIDVELPPGEASKSIAVAESVYRHLAERRFSRDGIILALGGGVISDLAGFVAATWMRGVRWAICPTTLEADIDAAIGGKTAINIPGGKNLVGAFHAPVLVVIDPACLRTLPEREFRAGLAESVKHALLSGEEFLSWHEANVEAIVAGELGVITTLIEKNVRFKTTVVEDDPLEQRCTRLILNFGHTVGHAIEECSGFALRHGECVSLGMIAACELSLRLGILDRTVTERVRALLERFGLPTRLAGGPTVEQILSTIELDKKGRSGSSRFVLLEGVGRPVIRGGVSNDLVQEVYAMLLKSL